MKAGNGHILKQAYNAQAAVNEVMLIVGQRGSDAPNDKQDSWRPCKRSVRGGGGGPRSADRQRLLQCGGRAKRGAKAGRDAEWLDVYAAVAKQSHHKTVADLLPSPEPLPLAADASPKEKMALRLQTSAGKTLTTPQANRRAGVWDHQVGAGLPAVFVARAGESGLGMAAGLREL